MLGDMDLVRPLVLAGVRCVVLAPPGSPPRYSRHAGALEWLDPWTDTGVVVDRLLAFARAQAAPPALFYQDTPDLLMVARHGDALRQGFRFVAADPQLVEELTDKAAFQALAERLDLPVPETRHLRPAADPAGWRVDLRPPLLIKPVTRRLADWGRVGSTAKAIEVESLDALHALWPRLASLDVELLAQELIPGPESRIESYHTYVDQRGEVVAGFTGRKLRTRPAAFGRTTALAITDAADVAALGQDVVARLGLTGVAKLDFKRTPRGELRLLEVNPRFTLWHHPAAAAGLNIPALVWADLNGLPRPPRARARAGITWCHPWEDALAAREQGELGLGWLRWAATCDTWSGLSLDDPMPLLRATVAPRLRKHARLRAARLVAAARPRSAPGT